MLQRYRIQCPESLMLLTKALTTIEGVAAYFDPTFDVIEHVEPQIQEIVVKRRSIGAIRRRFINALTSSFELLEDLPGDLQRFLDLARHSRFTLNLELKRIEHLSEQLDTSSRLMGIAMIIAALIVGSAILILADRMSRASRLHRHAGLSRPGPGRHQHDRLHHFVSFAEKKEIAALQTGSYRPADLGESAWGRVEVGELLQPEVTVFARFIALPTDDRIFFMTNLQDGRKISCLYKGPYKVYTLFLRMTCPDGTRPGENLPSPCIQMLRFIVIA